MNIQVKSNFKPEKYYSIGEIADLMGIGKQTLRKNLKELIPILSEGKRKRLYSPEETKIVLRYLGVSLE